MGDEGQLGDIPWTLPIGRPTAFRQKTQPSLPSFPPLQHSPPFLPPLPTWLHHVGDMLLHQSGADGQAPCQRLGQSHDVRGDAVHLVRPQLAWVGEGGG